MIQQEPPRISVSAQETVKNLEQEFAFFDTWEDRYAHIIHMARHLEPYPEEHRTDEYRVRGCTSQVWLYPTFDGARLHFAADSDAIIVKGLVAMLLRVYNHRTPDEVLAVDPDFIKRLGLDTHLSPSRANGLVSMIQQIRNYASASKLRAENSPQTITSSDSSSSTNQPPTRDAIIEAMHTVFDPEIPIDIYELGLIYEITVDKAGVVNIVMTLTTPNCPSAQTLPADVERAARAVPGVKDVNVTITFDPPWDKTMMSEAALFSIGLF